MALQILNAGPGPEPIMERIREAIENDLPGAVVDVACGSPGHFQIRVTSEAFAGLPKLKQHQRVYGAITALMSGADAPVHAVDRLECRLP